MNPLSLPAIYPLFPSHFTAKMTCLPSFPPLQFSLKPKPIRLLLRRHCGHGIHIVKSVAHLTWISVCHSCPCSSLSLTFFHFSWLSSYLTFHPFYSFLCCLFPPFFPCSVKVAQSSLHVLLLFSLWDLIHSQRFKYYFCASNSKIYISNSDFSPEIQTCIYNHQHRIRINV